MFGPLNPTVIVVAPRVKSNGLFSKCYIIPNYILKCNKELVDVFVYSYLLLVPTYK